MADSLFLCHFFVWFYDQFWGAVGDALGWGRGVVSFYICSSFYVHEGDSNSRRSITL